jgi:AcrR family transcriptional regulator
MARAFTEQEKAHIHQQLLDAGRDHFTRYGLKKTSIEDLTNAAGIAKSSFYLFFDSKEALYVELLHKESTGVEQRVLGASFHATDDIHDGMKRFLRAVIHEIETNALTRWLVAHPEDLDLLARRMTPEQVAAKTKSSLALIRPFVERGQEQGQIVAGRPEVIAGVIRAVTLLTLHKDTIGDDYPDVLEMMINLVVDGLKPQL